MQGGSWVDDHASGLYWPSSKIPFCLGCALVCVGENLAETSACIDAMYGIDAGGSFSEIRWYVAFP